MVALLDPPPSKVLEVGSYDVNGTVRDLFYGCEYCGLDARPGPGVDRLVDYGGRYPFPPGLFDLVVSTEMLEHDPTPWRSTAEMARMLKPGGTLLLTARGFDQRGCAGLHECPGDFTRWSLEGMRSLLLASGFEHVSVLADPFDPGVFAYATAPLTRGGAGGTVVVPGVTARAAREG